MGRKLVKDMTPEEKEIYRANMREAKARQRERDRAAGKVEIDRRKHRKRGEAWNKYQREYRARKKLESSE